MLSGATETATAGQALRAAASRTAELVSSAPNPNATAPGLSWNVAETAAHLVAELRNYTGFLLGTVNAEEDMALAPDAETPAAHSAAYNAAHLTAFTERDLHHLADMLVPAVDEFLAAGSARHDGERILTGTGIAMTAHTMTTVLLGEQLIHGLDIARAGNAKWPISRADALQVIVGVMAMVPDYVDSHRAAGLHVAYELRFRGGPRYRLLVDDGTATITEAENPVDCWISADPTAFLLVGYGRVSQSSQILRGRIVAGGRKPWLGATFGQLLTGP